MLLAHQGSSFYNPLAHKVSYIPCYHLQYLTWYLSRSAIPASLLQSTLLTHEVSSISSNNLAHKVSSINCYSLRYAESVIPALLQSTLLMIKCHPFLVTVYVTYSERSSLPCYNPFSFVYCIKCRCFLVTIHCIYVTYRYHT
jgi:hypothetical protein